MCEKKLYVSFEDGEGEEYVAIILTEGIDSGAGCRWLNCRLSLQIAGDREAFFRGRNSESVSVSRLPGSRALIGSVSSIPT